METPTPTSPRVCPRCGGEAGQQQFCGACGLNLAQQSELPDAEEYAARLRQEQWLRSQSSGPTAFQPTREVSAQEVAAAAATAPLAGWWIRAGAIVIDSLILLIPSIIIGLLLRSGVAGFVIYCLFSLALWFAYGLLMIRDEQNGQTLGMQAVGIRVRCANGEPVSVKEVAIRQLLMQGVVFGILFFLIVPYLLNYLWPLWDKENRALHDMAAKTRVVRA